MKIKELKLAFNNQYANVPRYWLQSWLLHIIKKPVSFLVTDDDYQLSLEQHTEFLVGVEKMRAGVPLAYLLGKQDFWSLEFIVNEHTLIPRADTEILIETVLNWLESNLTLLLKWQQASVVDSLKLLDLGTGSGCIAISLAYELANNTKKYGQWHVDAVDNSQQALEVVKKNIELNSKPNSINTINTIHSNWFANINKQEKYAIIVSNPPYIDSTDEHLTKLTKEPITALVSDNQGLADIEKIVEQAGNYLLKDGLLLIEHGYDQGKIVQQIFNNHHFQSIKTVKDYGDNDRVTVGIL